MANDEKIEIGDVVVISSHPTSYMTVVSIQDDEAQCVWFGPDGKIIGQDFNINAIQLMRKKGEPRK